MIASAGTPLIETVRQALTRLLVPPLKAMLGPLDRLLDAAPPWIAQVCAVSLFALAAMWVFTLKRQYVFQGAPDQARWRDLRIWAWLAMCPFVVLYLFFR